MPRFQQPTEDLEARLSRNASWRDNDDAPKGAILDWDGEEDPENPFNWPPAKKWAITSVTCFIALLVGINGTAIAAAAEDINSAFHVSDKSFPNSYWPITSWNVGAAIVPLAGLPLMELYGIRYGYLAWYFIFIIFIIPQAVAQNFATLVVTRFFCGAAAGVLENVPGEIVCNLWKGPRARSAPMGLYVWSLFAGITIGPVVGGGILHHLSWRWIFYIQLIVYGALFPFLYFAIPEMRHSVLLKHRAEAIRKETGEEVYAGAELKSVDMKEFFNNCFGRPTHMLFTEFAVASFASWSAFAFGMVFMFTQSIPQVYEGLYNWSPYYTSVVQGAVVIGELIGLLVSPLQNWLYSRSADRNKEEPGTPIPEARLYMSIFASLVGLTGGFFWYGWTSYSSLHWILPTIGLGLVGFGTFVVGTAATAYLTDSYSKYAASAVAAMAFAENTMAAFLPLATQSMYNTLGFHWASSLLGFVALLLSIAPIVLMIWGDKIRAKSPFIQEATR